MANGINKTHGKSKTSIYGIWCNMRNRCWNKDDENYGGRGITVCERWQVFENFYEDMGDRPTEEHTLERINNNGNYCKNNCKWATMEEQALNKSTNIRIMYNGEEKTLIEWTRILDLSYTAMLHRYKIGMRPPQLFTRPLGSMYSRGKGGEHPSAKIILDTKTGIYYDSLIEAAVAKNLVYKHLPSRLKGKLKNNTGLIYA